MEDKKGKLFYTQSGTEALFTNLALVTVTKLLSVFVSVLPQLQIKRCKNFSCK